MNKERGRVLCEFVGGGWGEGVYVGAYWISKSLMTMEHGRALDVWGEMRASTQSQTHFCTFFVSSNAKNIMLLQCTIKTRFSYRFKPYTS